jgi:diguanylate cyclase (GGDEF)-like protein/PAS domain S-box-containing protein
MKTTMNNAPAGSSHRAYQPNIPALLIEQAEQALAADLAPLERTVFDAAPDGILVVDTQGHILAANPALARLCGREPWALIGQPLDVLLPMDARDRHQAYLRRFFADPHPRPMGAVTSLELRRADGTLVPVDIALGVGVYEGRPCAVAFVRDVTETRRLTERLQHLAAHDPLTGLANRAQLRARLHDALVAAQRSGHTMALLLLDLDDFKRINDVHGHPAGDAVLQAVAERLRASVRTDDVVARLGGDEFAVLLPRVDGPADALRVADKALLALRRTPITVADLALEVDGSAGVACGPQDGADIEALLRAADLALYTSKAQGSGQPVRYAPALAQALDERTRIHDRLRHALRRGGLRLHYQPQVHARTGAVTGLEALLRWTDAELGPVPPARFIPVAESTGLMLALGDWVLQEACHQWRIWADQGWRVPIAVNVSAVQLRQEGFAAQVRDVLQQHGMNPACLELELTESVAMADATHARRVMGELAALGVRLALDDFGTGHSSLAVLRQLPVHRLKIDRSFLQRIPQDSTDVVLVRGVLALARTLGLQVVAEGVETEGQWAFLRRHRCPVYQGWWFAPALAANEVLPLLAKVGLQTA